VVVTNSDGQSGTLTGGFTYTGGSSGGSVSFVQVNYKTATSASSMATAYTAAQTAGNLNVVAVGWNDTTSTVEFGHGQPWEYLCPSRGSDRRNGADAINLLREEHCGGSKYCDRGVKPDGGLSGCAGAGV